MLQIKCSLFGSFFFFNVKAIFFSGEASCGYNTAGIIFYFYFIFLHKIPELLLQRAGKATNRRAVWPKECRSGNRTFSWLLD